MLKMKTSKVIVIPFEAYITGDKVEELKKKIEPTLNVIPSGTDTVYLDFSEVKSIDAHGFNFLIELYILCTKKSCSLKITHCPDDIHKQLEVFKLDCLFCITGE